MTTQPDKQTDWIKAEARLEATIEDLQSDPSENGYTGYPKWNHLVKPLKLRFDRGERSDALYRSIMSLIRGEK